MQPFRLKGKVVFPLLAVMLWQVFSAAGLLPAGKLPSPVQIIAAVQELTIHGLPQGSGLLFHCLYSLQRVGLGFVLALAAAIPLGILFGWSRLLRDMLNPVIETVRPIPPLAWIPLAILWFGIGLRSAAFIIFLGCFFPILLSTMSGVLSVDPVLVSAAKTLGATRRQIFYYVLLPGAMPSIFTGLRIGLGIGWMTLVAAEFTGVKSGYGLGYMIMTARDIQRPDLVIAGMAVIGLTGFLLDTVLRWFETRKLRWR
ncbi:MAG: ABC transporter permease [Deltaproteobacteria bacterium]|nr:ABC transporter permease [Deltaproteobacteria bacterium]